MASPPRPMVNIGVYCPQASIISPSLHLAPIWIHIWWVKKFKLVNVRDLAVQPEKTFMSNNLIFLFSFVFQSSFRYLFFRHTHTFCTFSVLLPPTRYFEFPIRLILASWLLTINNEWEPPNFDRLVGYFKGQSELGLKSNNRISKFKVIYAWL